MKRIRFSRWRVLGVLTFLALTAAGLAWHTGWGTLSAFGWGAVAAICPLGGLEAALAGQSVTLRAAVGIGVSLAFIILLGRAFCGWVCPAPWVQKLGLGRREKPARRVIPIKPVGSPVRSEKEGPAAKAPYWILGGALASSAVFGFPVFCLVCPAGLTFAILIGLWRLFELNIGGWSVLFFVIVLALELFVLRRWCHRLCPLGALVSLVSRLNFTFRPKIREAKCLRSQGLSCNVCREACPEGIDLTAGPSTAELSRCTKCHACADACPERAISFPFLARATPLAGAKEQSLVEPPSAAPKAAPNAAGGAPAQSASGEPVPDLARARSEGERCMMCGECAKACPMGNVIPLWMAELREGRPRAAARLMLEPGMLPEITSRVCPASRLCESVCSRSATGGAIPIHLIEQAAADAALKRGELPLRIRPAGKSAAVVGSGPAGLACADVLARAGIAVTLYEAKAAAGGLLTFGIPETKLPKSLVSRRVERLRALGVKFVFGQKLGDNLSLQALRARHDAVFLAFGASEPVPLEVKGSGLAEVLPGIEYLEARARVALRLDMKAKITARNRRVLVLGGGDTAIDCAEAALLDGAASVTLAYRGKREAMRAAPADIERIERAGVRLLFEATPEEVLADDRGALSGVRFSNGAKAPADLVLTAFGFRGEALPELVAAGVRYDDRGRILTESGSLETDAPGVYAGGDAVRGADLVVRAAADGKRAGEAIARALLKK